MNLDPQQQIQRLKDIQKRLDSHGGQDTVLIVDGDAEDSELARLALAKHGVKSQHVTSVNMACKLIQGNVPPLVFMGWKLEGVSGIEALRQLKALAENPVVVILTGVATDDDAVNALENGAAAVISKPLTDETIKLIFDSAL